MPGATTAAAPPQQVVTLPHAHRPPQDERGVSRDEMAVALLDVAEGRLPRDRLALVRVYEVRAPARARALPWLCPALPCPTASCRPPMPPKRQHQQAAAALGRAASTCTRACWHVFGGWVSRTGRASGAPPACTPPPPPWRSALGMLATRCPPAALLLQEIKEWPYLDAAASAPRGIAAAEEESRAAYGGGIQQDAGGRAAALAACAPAAVWRAAADVSPSPSRHITAQAGVAVQPWTHSPPNLTPPPRRRRLSLLLLLQTRPSPSPTSWARTRARATSRRA